MGTGIKGPKAGASFLPYTFLTDLFYHSGTRVKMTGHKLREQCLIDVEKTVLVACFLKQNHNVDHQDLTLPGHLIGHAFATAWDYDGGKYEFVDYQF